MSYARLFDGDYRVLQFDRMGDWEPCNWSHLTWEEITAVQVFGDKDRPIESYNRGEMKALLARLVPHLRTLWLEPILTMKDHEEAIYWLRKAE